MIAQLGKLLLLLGLTLVVLGVLMMVFDRFAPSGRLLPGDIVIRRPDFTLYLPLATMILVSLVLTGILWLISQFRQ